jgi:hypothetical protein
LQPPVEPPLILVQQSRGSDDFLEPPEAGPQPYARSGVQAGDWILQIGADEALNAVCI